MRQIILSLIMVAASFLRVNAQQDSLAVKLLALEQQAFYCKNDTDRNSFFLQKVNAYISGGEVDHDALAAVKRVDASLVDNAELKNSFLWNAALVCHLNRDFNAANSYFSRYLESKKDTSVADAVLGTLIFNENDTARVTAFVAFAARSDSTVKCLSCLNEVTSYQKKGKRFFILSSYLVPGSGSMTLGHVLKGAVSLLIFSGIGAGVYLMVTEGLYLNAAFFASPWLGKFYGGQIRLTRKLFDEKELKRKGKMASRCGEKLNEVLIKYPLDFRK
jgi:hypothetical protein